MREVSHLEALAKTSVRVARDASALASFEAATLDHLSRTAPITVVVADSLLAEKYNDPPACLAWLSGAYRLWLQANHGFNVIAGRQMFYRFVLLPYPSAIGSWPLRRLFIETVLLHLHQLIARILEDFGFSTELTRITGDGGKDIIAYLNNEMGRFVTYVECKKYLPTKPVGIEVIQRQAR